MGRTPRRQRVARQLSPLPHVGPLPDKRAFPLVGALPSQECGVSQKHLATSQLGERLLSKVITEDFCPKIPQSRGTKHFNSRQSLAPLASANALRKVDSSPRRSAIADAARCVQGGEEVLNTLVQNAAALEKMASAEAPTNPNAVEEAFKQMMAIAGALPAQREILCNLLTWLEPTMFTSREFATDKEYRPDTAKLYAFGQICEQEKLEFGRRHCMSEQKDILLYKPSDRIPYFMEAQRLKFKLSQNRHMMQQYYLICSGINGQRGVADCILEMSQELTSTVKWCFVFWKVDYLNRNTLEHQMVHVRFGGKSTSEILLLQSFLKWRIFSHGVAVAITMKECQERGQETQLMHRTMPNLESYREEIASDLASCRRSNQKLELRYAEIEQSRKSLQNQWDMLKPNLLKTVFTHALKLLLEHIANVGGLRRMKTHRAMVQGNLSILLKPDDETLERAAKLTAENMLIRWVNHVLLEAKLCAAGLLQAETKETPSDMKSAWSSKDAPKYSHWCHLIRGLHPIENLSGDLIEGTALLALFAVHRALYRGQSVFDPADLWLLDQKDPERRVSSLCNCLRSIAPTEAAQRFIHDSDISSGDSATLTPFLSALFLADLYGVKPLSSETADPCGAKCNEIVKAAGRNPSRTQVAQCLLKALEESGGIFAYANLADPSCLLLEEENLSALFRLQPKDLLLRWVNMHTAQLALSTNQIWPVQDWKTDFQDGWVLANLLRAVAPETCDKLGMDEDSYVTEEGRLVVIGICGERCVQPFSLEADLISTGDEDAIAEFVASLFLSHPCMPPVEDSLVLEGLRCLEHMFETGSTLADCSSMDSALFVKALREFHLTIERHEDSQANKSMASILLIQAVQERMNQRMQTLVGELTVKRILGSTMDFAERPLRNHARFNLASMKVENWKGIMANENLALQSVRAWNYISTNTRFLADVFRHYSIGAILPLPRLMDLYRNCHLGSPCMSLSLEKAQSLYYQLIDLSTCRPGKEGLSEQGFLQWVMRAASQQQQPQQPQQPHHPQLQRKRQLSNFVVSKHPPGFRQCLKQLFEYHMRPHALKPPNDEFAQLLADVPLQVFLSQRDSILYTIFEAYGEEATNETCTVTSVTLHVSGLMDIFKHACVLKGLLITGAVWTIFASVQAHWNRKTCRCQQAQEEGCPTPMSCKAVEAPEPGSFTHQDGLLFFQFRDVLVAAALYANPSLVVPVNQRVEVFLSRLFEGLKGHCAEHSPAEGSLKGAMFEALEEWFQNDDDCLEKVASRTRQQQEVLCNKANNERSKAKRCRSALPCLSVNRSGSSTGARFRRSATLLKVLRNVGTRAEKP